MTKHNEPDRKNTRDRLANCDLGEKNGHAFDDAVRLTDLFVERAQNISLIDSKSRAENYTNGELLFYVLLACHLPNGQKHLFPFLIGQEMLKLGWPKQNPVDVSVYQANTVTQIRGNGDQIFPMLVFVSDLVNCPEGVISSGVWSLGTQENPLGGSEFLFQSVLPGHPFTWKFFRLPGLPVDATEWEPYARCSTLVVFNKCDHRLVQRSPKALDYFDAVKCDIDTDVFLAACNYMKEVRITVNSDRVWVGLDIPIDDRYQILEFAASTGDIFL